jgi:hypothetical protein
MTHAEGDGWLSLLSISSAATLRESLSFPSAVPRRARLDAWVSGGENFHHVTDLPVAAGLTVRKDWLAAPALRDERESAGRRISGRENGASVHAAGMSLACLRRRSIPRGARG